LSAGITAAPGTRHDASGRDEAIPRSPMVAPSASPSKFEGSVAEGSNDIAAVQQWFARTADEIEVNLGSLDAPEQLMPICESWIVRRNNPTPKATTSNCGNLRQVNDALLLPLIHVDGARPIRGAQDETRQIAPFAPRLADFDLPAVADLIHRAAPLSSRPPPMKTILRVISTFHGLMAVLFACAAVVLIVIAARVGWDALAAGFDRTAAQGIIEAVGLLAAAVVALQIAQTIVEEEVIRDSHISAPSRVRRFLSRFLVVVVVSLAIEGLVATFKAIHEDMTHLAYAAGLLASVALLMAAWGIFVRLNRYAEELEPEAMEAAKREDRKLK
jgi:hypothetical protein